MIRSITFLLALLIFSATMAQTPTNYETKWKEIDDLLKNQGLVKTAIDEVKEIYQLAIKEKQEPQQIKALIYLSTLEEDLDEEGEAKGIAKLEAELKNAKAPVSQILHSVIAGKYYSYFQQNRWRLYDRTAIQNTGDNLESLGIEELHEKISHHYRVSLHDVPLLQTTRLEKYDPLIEKGNVRELRPTLYDMLAQQALEYFKNDERDLKKPSYQFTISDPKAFSPAAEFIKTEFKTSDTSSLYYQALLIYQQLLAQHLEDADPTALLDVDIDRLEFVHQVSVMENKNLLFHNALLDLQTRYPKNEYGALAGVIRLEDLYNEAMDYQPGVSDPAKRFALVGLRKELETLQLAHPNTDAGARAKNLLINIDQRSINAKTELVNLPGKPFLALISFRNLSSFHYRILKADNMDEFKRTSVYDEFWINLVNKADFKQGRQPLPQSTDLREHKVEIRMDALPVGSYALLCSASEDFSLNTNQLTVQFFHVSQIAYMKKADNLFVLDRESGAPLAGADVKIMEQKYDERSGLVYIQVAQQKANDNGYLKISAQNKNNYSLDISWKKDRLFTKRIEQHIIYDPSSRKAKEETFSTLFTDRSIYRPGQLVYFKGIMIRKNGYEKSSIVAGAKAVVTLHDANGQKKDSLVLTTNEYGSFHGSFSIPENLLTGNFSIRNGSNSIVWFSVEEYKRPTFEIIFEKLDGSYRVNDSILLSGTVAGYAGNNLNNASVKYRVVRRTNLPWWRMGWWPRQEEMEITHGETMTDQLGKFSIPFKAIPDLSVDKKLDPHFSYQVTVDATDNSGETRSNAKSIELGYQAINLRLALEDMYHHDSLKQVIATATNAEGTPQSLPLTLKITLLQPPSRLLKTRYWEVPDTSILSKQEFIRSFPNDPYMNEAAPSTWDRSKEILNLGGNTGTIKIDQTLAPGYYLVEVSARDKYGEEVKDMKYVKLIGKTVPYPAYTWTTDVKITAEPGSSVNVAVGTSADKVFAISQTDRPGKEDDDNYQILRLKNNWHQAAVPVTESDRGGFSITHAFVKHNRFHQVTNEIEVPWSNKKLDISIETYRDKLLPGAKETWKLKINGNKGEKVAAEMLTSMYDASLDQFRPHNWQFPSLFPGYTVRRWDAASNFTMANEETRYYPQDHVRIGEKVYDRFIWNNLDNSRMTVPMMAMAAPPEPLNEMVQVKVRGKASISDTAGYDLSTIPAGTSVTKEEGPILARKNFNETAFFFPNLTTDENGDISFSFSTPESLTKWKWQMLAHTKELASGLSVKNIVTQKDLMIQPNMPRFLREGDKIRLSARVSNLTDKEITGQAFLQLIDPATGKSVDGWFQNIFPSQYFTVDARQTGAVFFEIQVPANYNRPLQYRVLARAGQQTDGEENFIAVLSNRILVNESLPLIMKGNGSRNYQFKGLLASGGSKTIANQSVTLEYSTNPAWYAVLALPYLIEYPYECSEQNFNRFYANALASLTANSSPAIKALFEKWKTSDTAALISNLMKNPELKNIILEQTPWVMQAASESEQRRNIALLFDLTRLSKELSSNLSKLREMQLENGAFPWFKGGRDDRYITQYILTGIGRLNKLQAMPAEATALISEITRRGLAYVDKKIKEDHEDLIRNKADLKQDHLTHIQIQYLYLRSFFSDTIPSSTRTAYDYYLGQAKKNWVSRNLMNQAMIALVMTRSNNKELAKAITRSLKETSINTPDLGMYWKNNSRGYYWYQSPIETQAQVIEAFAEIGTDQASVEDMKLWLLNQKRVQGWSTTKATADAVYAILKTGRNMLSDDPEIKIQLGTKEISSTTEHKEAGTGYFKTVIPGAAVNAKMGEVKLSVQANSNSGISWGAVHWQYFEDMDKVKAAVTPVQLSRIFFTETNTDKGPVLTEIRQGDELKVGDKLKVRIVLKADRDMEYMHLKDLRASGTEPVNVLSSYKWQGGLGYYEATRDASTDFFFSWLPKGTWVFEYPLFVTHAGEFAAGISTIQSMYAPEFNAHSEGIRIGISAREEK